MKKAGRPVGKIPFSSKKKVQIFLPQTKIQELKEKAVKAGVSLSDLISISASEYDPSRINQSGKDITPRPKL